MDTTMSSNEQMMLQHFLALVASSSSSLHPSQTADETHALATLGAQHQREAKSARQHRSKAVDSAELSGESLASNNHHELAVSQTGKSEKGKCRRRTVKPLLTDDLKKKNHIRSEQKRRQNIRQGFDSLMQLVPGLLNVQRSESVILQRAIERIELLVAQKQQLKSRALQLKLELGQVPSGTTQLESSDDEAASRHKTTTTKIRTYRRTVYNNNKRRRNSITTVTDDTITDTSICNTKTAEVDKSNNQDEQDIC